MMNMSREDFFISALGVVIWIVCTVWWTVGMTS
jgi:hypothetical protein